MTWRSERIPEDFTVLCCWEELTSSLGDVNARLLKGNETGELSHLRAEGRPNLDGAVVGSGRARRNT
jgi:hypothetical protein